MPTLRLVEADAQPPIYTIPRVDYSVTWYRVTASDQSVMEGAVLCSPYRRHSEYGLNISAHNVPAKTMIQRFIKTCLPS